MNIKAFSDVALLPCKRDVLRVHLYLRLIQYGIRPLENDMDIILELYEFGGYSNSMEQTAFINMCMQKQLRKSEQSIRNTLSKYVSVGVFEKPKNTRLSISDKFLPLVECDKLMLKYSISHAE